MTLTPPIRCSALADELGEPMIGSVDQRRRWLLVEDRSAWGEKAVRDVLGGDLEAAARERSIRLLLVRRREGDPAADVVRRAFLVDCLSRVAAVRTLDEPSELGGLLDLEPAAFGTAWTDPLVLVCTNGKRDACCALRGRALVSSLGASHPDLLWECTHLGGHRFAANLVFLPAGVVYGRVTAADGPRLVTDLLDGRLDPAHLRGRSPWPPAAQVAEAALRERLGLTGIDDLRLVDVDTGTDRATVVLGALDGATHRLELRTQRLAPPRPISCRADELEEPLHWRLVN
jgi:Sucrase/ferredoxin-like